MYRRLTRIRFIVVRSCFISFIIILILQILALRNNDNNIEQTDKNSNKLDEEFLSSDKLFWRKLLNQDKELTDKQRIKKVKLNIKQNEINNFNWTNIFFDIYSRKLKKLYERDGKTSFKYRFEENQQNNSQQKFRIFEETPVFQRPKFCSSTRIFHPQCPYSNCQWSCEEPSITHKIIRRASVFHHVDIDRDQMFKKIRHRSHNDIWILWIDEANRQIEHLNQYQFNWTLSFRQDSEVSIGSYGLLIPRTKKRKNGFFSNNSLSNNLDFIQILTNRNIPINDMLLENHILTNYRYRHKHALWFVSNCGPKRRFNYYKQLKNFYPINVFGSCVEKKCDKNDYCESDQSHLALFYLAFESQTCRDYITEKFWRALYYGMIPIVLGPSKQSYLDLGIPQSAFIHIDDFKSEKDLAYYLHQISNDYFLYREYFQWLNQYEIFYDINVLEPIRMCELCMRLNMQKFQEHSFYTNIHQWHRTGC